MQDDKSVLEAEDTDDLVEPMERLLGVLPGWHATSAWVSPKQWGSPECPPSWFFEADISGRKKKNQGVLVPVYPLLLLEGPVPGENQQVRRSASGVTHLGHRPWNISRCRDHSPGSRCWSLSACQLLWLGMYMPKKPDTWHSAQDRIWPTSLWWDFWLLYITIVGLSKWIQIRWPSRRMVQNCRNSRIAGSARLLIGRFLQWPCPLHQGTQGSFPTQQAAILYEEIEAEGWRTLPFPEPDCWVTKPGTTWSLMSNKSFCPGIAVTLSHDNRMLHCRVLRWNQVNRTTSKRRIPSETKTVMQNYLYISEIGDWTFFLCPGVNSDTPNNYSRGDFWIRIHSNHCSILTVKVMLSDRACTDCFLNKRSS